MMTVVEVINAYIKLTNSITALFLVYDPEHITNAQRDRMVLRMKKLDQILGMIPTDLLVAYYRNRLHQDATFHYTNATMQVGADYASTYQVIETACGYTLVNGQKITAAFQAAHNQLKGAR